MVNTQTPKIEAQVVDAIRRLQAVQGSTQREIVNYISHEYNLPASEVRRQVQIALKRGVTYGILQRMKRGCFTYNQQLFKEHPFDTDIEIPCKRRKKGRRKSRRRSRKRRKSRERQSKTSSRTRRDRKAEEIVNEIDGSQLKMMAKRSKSNSLLRKDVPESEDSSTTSKFDEIYE